MLRLLEIRDILTVERLELAFQPGLNVLTGETGAGKSILLDALGLALGWGDRADLTRPGAERGEVTAFYLTDFLARQFDAFVWRSLGLDRNPDLRDDYFGNYETLVYLAQTDDPRLTEIARGCADRLGLAFERRFTGLAPFAALLADGVKDNPPG